MEFAQSTMKKKKKITQTIRTMQTYLPNPCKINLSTLDSYYTFLLQIRQHFKQPEKGNE